jgi:hypothetical protein
MESHLMISFACATVLASLLGVTSAFAVGNSGYVSFVGERVLAHSHPEKGSFLAKKGKKKAKKPVAVPVQYAPSGESIPIRERRLRRECKGRPNAGACLGYAS